MVRPIGSRSGVVTKGEMEIALRSAYEKALVRGSDLAIPGSVRAPLLDIAHDLGAILDRIGPSKPISSPPDMTPHPASKVLHADVRRPHQLRNLTGRQA